MNYKKDMRMVKIYPVRLISFLIIYVGNLMLFNFFRSYFFILLGIILSVLPVVSILFVIMLRSRLTVKVDVPFRYGMTTEVNVMNITVDNPTFFPSMHVRLRAIVDNSFFGDRHEQVFVLPVRVYDKFEMELPLKSEYIGIIRVRVMQAAVSDILGIFELKITDGERKGAEQGGIEEEILSQNEFIVFPSEGESEGEDESLLSGVEESDDNSMKGNDITEVSGIREYVQGDRMKDIHWKISARMENLMVKERIGTAANRLNVLVDLSGDREQKNEIVSRVYQLCHRMVRQQTGVGLFWWNSITGSFEEEGINRISEIKPIFERIYRTKGTSSMSREELMKGFAGSQPAIVSYAITGIWEGYIKTRVVEKVM